MDYWFFSTDFGHLPFHIKNTWLQFWFDHGWLGLLLMLAMVVLVSRRALAAPPGQCFTPMAATAVLGLGALGMFGTPLDEARVSWLFYLLLFAGVLEPSRRAAPLTFSAPLAFRMAR
jgi:O-antigen ligase